MGYLCLLLGCFIVLSLPGAHALSSSEQTLQNVFADLIIRLKKWIHDNEAELKVGMSAIRKHLAQWGIGLGPSGQHSKRWLPEKTSNNIRPKPIQKPFPSLKPPSWTKAPKDRVQIPRWNRKTSRLNKSPYDKNYFRTHRRVGRSVLTSGNPQREELILQCLDILSGWIALAHSVKRSSLRSGNRIEEILEQKKGDLDKMSTDELKSLVKQLNDSNKSVMVSPKSGEITIDGKVVNIDNIDHICCPFG